MNKVILIGRLARDVESKTTAKGLNIASFTLAVDRQDKDKGADFIRITAFGKTAEICGKYLSKGSLIAVDGRLQTDSYGKDGQKRTVTTVIANNITFLQTKQKCEVPVSDNKAPISDLDGFVDLGEGLPF